MGVSDGENLHEPAKVRSGKRIVVWFLKGLLVAISIWLIFLLTGRSLRHIALVQVAELTNTVIETGRVNFALNGSVSIGKLVVRPYERQDEDDAILRAEVVYARFGIGSLLLLRPRLKEVRVKDFVFDARWDLDTERWNLAGLEIKRPRGGSGKMPLIRLEEGVLRYSKALGGQVKVIAEVPLDVELAAAKKKEKGYSFKITTAKRAGFGKSTLTGFWQSGNVAIAGGLSSADVPAFERAWTIDVLAIELDYDRSNSYSLKLRIKDLRSRYSPSADTSGLGASTFSKGAGAFNSLQRFFNGYRPFGQVDIDLRASGNLGRLSKSTVAGKVYCKDIFICDRKFPYVIERLNGEIDFTEKSVVLNNLSGWHNDVKLCIGGWRKGFGPSRQYQIQITSENMALDNELYEALSGRQKKLWSVFSPSGPAAIDYRISRESQTERKKTVAVELLGAEAVYRRFPYPLKNLRGKLLFDYNSVTLSDLVCGWENRKININGQVTGRKSARPVYDICISAKDIPLDSALVSALSERQRYLYERYCMKGEVDAEIKVFTPEQGQRPVSFTADVSYNGNNLRTSQPSLAISDVSGRSVFTPDTIDIESLRGRYGGGRVELGGRVWPGRDDEQVGYCLLLRAEGAQLSDELLALLPEPLERTVCELEPRGEINFSANLNRGAAADCNEYRVTVDCLGTSIKFDGLAWPLKDIRGRITMTKDNIELTDLTATVDEGLEPRPKASRINLSGRIALSDNALVGGEFAICANDVAFDERLGISWPEGTRSLYSRLSPGGRFDLELEKIKVSPETDSEVGERSIDVAGTARFRGCSLNAFGGMTELNAALKTKGSYKGGRWFADGDGELVAESLRIKGKALTGLRAEVNYDRERRSWSTKNLIADCYGGRLTGRFELKQPADAVLEYLLQVGFDSIDLEQFLSDRVLGAKGEGTSGNNYSRGKMSGSLSVSGRIGGVGGEGSSRIGRLRLKIIDMQVGRLSPLAKLLRVLQLSEPKDFAFDQMFVDSYIEDDKLFLERFDLSGDAVAFNGSGWMDLESKNVDLTLTARGRRLATAEPSVWQSLTENLGRGVVKMEVTGDFYDPQITTKTLPLIERTLGILGTKPAAAD